MTRLNNRIREQIVNNAVDKAGINKKKDEIRERRATWVESVRVQAIGGREVEAKIKVAEKKIKSALKDIPASLISGPVIRTDYDIYLNVAGCTTYGYFHDDDNRCEGERVYKVTPSSHTIKQGDPLVDEFHAIEEADSEVKNEERIVRANVIGALSKIRSVEHLLKLWPEAKELLPKVPPPVKEQLPSVKTEDLNAMIGLPTEA